MKIEGPGQALAIFIGETDHFGGKPLYVEIVERAHNVGLAGATVTHGIMGFGANSRVHSAGILRLSEDLPVRIEIIDSREKIQAFLPQLDELVQEGVVVTWDISIEIYRHTQS
ncbi:MAG TPA: DUF190 domain-containing protein [Fimbriimonadaceae bacterium]|jgi:hypothetical protein